MAILAGQEESWEKTFGVWGNELVKQLSPFSAAKNGDILYDPRIIVYFSKLDIGKAERERERERFSFVRKSHHFPRSHRRSISLILSFFLSLSIHDYRFQLLYVVCCSRHHHSNWPAAHKRNVWAEIYGKERERRDINQGIFARSVLPSTSPPTPHFFLHACTSAVTACSRLFLLLLG